jgi:arylsulfatase A-like enzyme
VQQPAERPDGAFTPRDLARAMIGNLDRNVGRLLEALRANGQADHTLVIFTSDNGGSDAGPGRVLQHNGGLRGRKSTFYEGGIRVPLIFRWPRQLPAGKTYDQPVSLLDIYPTVLAAAEPPHITTQPLDGVDLMPYLAGRETGVPHQRLFWTLDEPSRWAVREGEWKLVYEDTDPASLGKKGTVRNMKIQLYNLSRDSFEQNDLLDEEPENVAELRRQLEQFMAEGKPSLYDHTVRAAHEAALAARKQDPALQEVPSVSGAPGHWSKPRKTIPKIPAASP